MGNISIVKSKGNQSAHHLPALYSRGAGINHKTPQIAVGHYLKDMTVTAHKQFGP